MDRPGRDGQVRPTNGGGRMRRNRWNRSVFAGAMVAAALLAGCAHWSKSRLAPPGVVAAQPRDLRIRAVLQNGEGWVLRDASVVGDSLVGELVSVEQPYDRRGLHVRRFPAGVRAAVALSNLDRIEVRRKDLFSSIVLLLALLALGFIGLLYIAAAHGAFGG